MTFADKVNQFNRTLSFSGKLPKGIKILNPFRGNPEILEKSALFYKKFYDDNEPRKFILGINPGRLGAGATGIPFTDTKRLSEICNISIDSVKTHEPSSVFVYEVIDKYGGVERFYNDFYINSLSPLGFVQKNKKGNWVNCNFYDYEELFLAMKPFIIETLKTQINFGIETDICYVLGKKNAKYLEKINREEHLFGKLLVVDHPRYIQQYKSKMKDDYVEEYLGKLR